ncbi:MAG: Ppx/GppA family phosphatase [Myxococcota bacterium]|nr:Ppx/GppA family phosphatase [Myxococcota bacterium]
MRVATVDIGTNTVLLLVAERSAEGEVHAVAEHATITRLGQDVDRTRRLLPDAIARTAACLDEYAQVVQALDVERVAVVGTSAMRDAGGGDEVRAHVRESLGVEARVVSGDEEARLTFRGALSGLPFEGRDRCAVFDLGGGSTEVVMGEMDGRRPQIAFAASYDVGSVRLTERCVRHDPLTAEEQAAITHVAAEAFSGVPEWSAALPPIGVAGTMTTLAAVFLKMHPYDAALVHGFVMTREELRRVVEQLARLDVASRRRLPGMEPKRADVVVAGGCIAVALLDHWGATRVRISDRGVRWGLAEELLDESQ